MPLQDDIVLDSNVSCCSATAWQPCSNRSGLWGFSFLLIHLGLFVQYNFQAAALSLHLEDVVSSKAVRQWLEITL